MRCRINNLMRRGEPLHADVKRARLSTVVVLIAFVALAAQPIRAWSVELTPAQQRAILEEAQQAYDRGMAIVRNDPTAARQEFQSAAERFQLIVDDGIINGRLLYNLGNAYLQAGDVGRAILNYRRADRLIGRDSRLQHNLEFARSLRRTPVEQPRESDIIAMALVWHDLPLRWRFGAFVAVNALLWLTLTLRLLRPGGGWWIAGAVVIIWLALGWSVASDIAGFGRSPAGVLVSDDVVIRKGDGAGYEPVFEEPLHAGVEFEVRGSRADWLLIALPSGQEGWIEAKTAELVP